MKSSYFIYYPWFSFGFFPPDLSQRHHNFSYSSHALFWSVVSCCTWLYSSGPWKRERKYEGRQAHIRAFVTQRKWRGARGHHHEDSVDRCRCTSSHSSFCCDVTRSLEILRQIVSCCVMFLHAASFCITNCGIMYAVHCITLPDVLIKWYADTGTIRSLRFFNTYNTTCSHVLSHLRRRWMTLHLWGTDAMHLRNWRTKRPLRNWEEKTQDWYDFLIFHVTCVQFSILFIPFQSIRTLMLSNSFDNCLFNSLLLLVTLILLSSSLTRFLSIH